MEEGGGPESVAIVDVGVGAGVGEGTTTNKFYLGGNRQCEAGLWDREACDDRRTIQTSSYGITRQYEHS